MPIFRYHCQQCNLDFEPSLIMDVYHRALQGYDVVAAAPKHGVPLTSKLFYSIYNWGSKTQYKIRQERFQGLLGNLISVVIFYVYERRIFSRA